MTGNNPKDGPKPDTDPQPVEGELLAPSEHAHVPDAGLPPARKLFGIAVLHAIKFGSARAAWLSYHGALSAKTDALDAAAGMARAQIELQRQLDRLEDIEGILATDQALRDDDRAEAEHQMDLGKIRRERQILEEKIELAKARQQHVEYEGSPLSSATPEQAEILEVFKAELKDKFGADDPTDIHHFIRTTVEQFIEFEKEQAGEGNLTDGDKQRIAEMRQFADEFRAEITEDKNHDNPAANKSD